MPRPECGSRPSGWWTPPACDEGAVAPDAAEWLTETLRDAVRIRAATEVPSTALVSGGLDSAIVQAIARYPRVYCATFPADGIDCMPLARLAAQGAQVVPVTFDLDEARGALPHIAYHLDTPATWSALALWFLARQMHRDGVRVVLSGEGADEVFGGYSRYRMAWWVWRREMRFFWRRRAMSELRFNSAPNPSARTPVF